MSLRQPTAVVAPLLPTGAEIFSQPLPSNHLPALDPFLLLHHHGPHQLPPDNAGLPFGPHPHRGFATLTVILAGSLIHRDSHGFHSQVDAPGAQWMTAGRGLIHNEMLPKELLQDGGPLEMLQLWINLPARLKMTPAHYEALPAARIPEVALPGGALARILTGELAGLQGAYQTPAGVNTALLRVPAGAAVTLPVPAEQSVMLYVLAGMPSVNDKPAPVRSFVAFDATTPAAGAEVLLTAGDTETLLFYGAGQPLREPVAQYGPFVMNTQKELLEAMRDYQMGRMGVYIEE